jgi:cytochrome c-type biogenesis protein CcmE
MTPRQKKRLIVVLVIILATVAAAALALKAFQESITYFLNPKDIAEGQFDTTSRYRVGGIVKTGSVKRLEDGITVEFQVTDCIHDVTVRYEGILPDLFREGQGIVSDGRFDENAIFKANQVLAKHDENYVPSELAEEMLEKQRTQCDEPQVESGDATEKGAY